MRTTMLRATAAGSAVAWTVLMTGCSHAPRASQAAAAPVAATAAAVRRSDPAPAWRPTYDPRWAADVGPTLQAVSFRHDSGRGGEIDLPRGAHLAAHLAEAMADRRSARPPVVLAVAAPVVELSIDPPRWQTPKPAAAATAAPGVAYAAPAITEALQSAAALSGPWQGWAGSVILALLLPPMLIWTVGQARRVMPARAAHRPAPRSIPPAPKSIPPAPTSIPSAPTSQPMTMREIDIALSARQAPTPPGNFGATVATALPWRDADHEHSAAQVLLVTSPSYDTDNAAVAAELAELWAANGRRVVLVESDLRSPHAQRQLGITGRPEGLTDVLIGAHDDAQAVARKGRAGVDVLACGTHDLQAAEELFKPRLAQVMQTLRKRYDKVVVHATPVMVAGDALAFAGCVDAAWLVVPAGRRESAESAASVQRLEHAGIRVDQVVTHSRPALPLASTRR